MKSAAVYAAFLALGMKSAAVCAAFLALGRVALGAEEAESLAVQKELERVMQEMPRVPKVLNPGADGFPRMPPLEGVTALFDGAKRSLSMDAGRMAEHLKKLEEDDQAEVKKQRASLLMRLGDQEKKNQVFVSENQELARKLIGTQKQTKLLKLQMSAAARNIRERRERLAKFSDKFHEAQKFADRMLTNSELHLEDLPKDKEASEEDASGVSFLELEMDKKKKKKHKHHAKRRLLLNHKQWELNLDSAQAKDDLHVVGLAKAPTQNEDHPQIQGSSEDLSLASAQNKAAVHVDGLSKEDEDAITELLRGVQGVQGEVKRAVQKIKDDYELSYQVGSKRLEVLKSQQKLLKKGQADEEAYARKLKVALKKLLKTSHALDTAVSNQDYFVGNLKRTADNGLSLLAATAA